MAIILYTPQNSCWLFLRQRSCRIPSSDFGMDGSATELFYALHYRGFGKVKEVAPQQLYAMKIMKPPSRSMMKAEGKAHPGHKKLMLNLKTETRKVDECIDTLNV
ncbi:unnamed protein product [Durusdinium trenchii]|uniref:Uncharacterized protein n=1 Tax=Durusdinium trenchii TaxID=1381693 RepID=A0ABP0N1G7_9DINO